jgi:hypothetical protein
VSSGEGRCPGSVSDRAIRSERDLEHGDQVPPTGLGFNSRRHQRISSIRQHENITGFEVRGRVLEGAEVVSGGVVKAVDRHGVLEYRPVRRVPRSVRVNSPEVWAYAALMAQGQ